MSFNSVPIELAQKLISYDCETGILIWKPRGPEFFDLSEKRSNVFNKKLAGKEALSCVYNGYKSGQFLKTRLFAHRVAWALHHGCWPRSFIDHIDGDRLNNKISNLRVVDRIENARNRKINSVNKSGVLGVAFRDGRWLARISDGNRPIHLGNYATFSEAVAARYAAEKVLGYHENHGKR